ncbi:hypothetical protein YWIDRAFT_07982 [Streptomyces sp. SceaMP-e96]|nr:hypothetical protein YWIDRAFT_07982 [Streptomyces sp. SceaMP-e96]
MLGVTPAYPSDTGAADVLRNSSTASLLAATP